MKLQVRDIRDLHDAGTRVHFALCHNRARPPQSSRTATNAS
jgi:hypothetical protein